MHTFDEYLERAFEQLGRYATGDPDVVTTLLESLERIADAARRAGWEERATPLRLVAERVALPALAEARTEHDRGLIRSALAPLSSAPR